MRANLFLALLLLCAAPAAAQHGRAGAPPERHGPVEILLRQHEELGLSAAQLQRLQQIQREMEERNRPLVARLLEIRRAVHPRVPPAQMTPEQRAELRRGAREARPLLEQVRANNRAAMRQVGEVLTPEQKERVRALVQERVRQRGHSPRHRPEGREPPR